MKIVMVEWIDAACETHGQLSLEAVEALTPLSRRNVGYLVREDKDKIVLSFGDIADKDHQCSAYDVSLVIPRGTIKSIKELK